MLEFKNVTKIFNAGTIDERVALDNLNLKINDGEFVTIIGGNGSGKSTLMNCISGVFQIDNGQIILDEKDITNLQEHRRAKFLGRVFQDVKDGTCSNMLVEENLALAKRRGLKRSLKWGISKEEKEDFKEQLKQFNLGLEDRLTAKVGLLSGGQRQVVTLLMASLNNPKLLLLDEHTAALDPKTAKLVLEATEKIVRSNNITTIMVTHNMKDAIKYGDRLIMMKEGKIVIDLNKKQKEALSSQDLLNLFNKEQG